MRSVKTILLISIFMILTISFATSPEPPPYFRYNVDGYVVSDSLSDKSNFTVMLYGKMKFNEEEGILINWDGGEFDRRICLTDSTGNYQLASNFPILFDSLKVALIRPGKAPYLSEAYPVDTLQLHAQYKDYLVPSGSGCSSCSVQPQSDYVTKSKLEYYHYYLSATEISVCE